MAKTRSGSVAVDSAFSGTHVFFNVLYLFWSPLERLDGVPFLVKVWRKTNSSRGLNWIGAIWGIGLSSVGIYEFVGGTQSAERTQGRRQRRKCREIASLCAVTPVPVGLGLSGVSEPPAGLLQLRSLSSLLEKVATWARKPHAHQAHIQSPTPSHKLSMQQPTVDHLGGLGGGPESKRAPETVTRPSV